MRGLRSKILALCILCALVGILTGCPRGFSEEERAREQKMIEQAMAIAEEPIRRYYPNVDLSKYYIRADYNSKLQDYTDWVGGFPRENSEDFEGTEIVEINIVTKEIYVSYEWPRMNAYVEKLFKDLYHLNQFDHNDIEYSITGYKRVPCYANEPENETRSMINVLPLGVIVDDDFCQEFLESGEYWFTYTVKVSENVNMNLFKEADVNILGSNAHVYVDQYSNEVFHDETKRYDFDKTKRDLVGEKTIETYEAHSENSQKNAETKSDEATVENSLTNEYFSMVAITSEDKPDDVYEITFTFQNVTEKAYLINDEKVVPSGTWMKTISYPKTKWADLTGKKNWIHYKLYDEEGNLLFSGGLCFVVNELPDVTEMELFEE